MDGANFRGKKLFSELSTDKVVNILLIYPTISIEWLLFGKGEMIKQPKELKVEEDKEVYFDNIAYKDKYFEVLEKYYIINEELVRLKKTIIKKNGTPHLY